MVLRQLHTEPPERIDVQIEQLIDDALRGLSCNYALYYRPRGGPSIVRKNCDLFLAASIIKIPILYAWSYLERAGVVSLDEVCELDAKPAVEGAGLAWLLRQRTLPYHDVLLLMMALSDNLCANLVIHRLGIDRLAAVFRELGLPDAKLARKLMDYDARASGLENEISPADCIRLFELRDQLPLVQKRWIEPMLLWNTDLGLWLRNVPRDSVVFHHKTGSMTGILHDWGYTKSADLFLLTQAVQDETQVYRVFNRLGPALLV